MFNQFAWNCFRRVILDLIPGGGMINAVLESKIETEKDQRISNIFRDFEHLLDTYREQHHKQFQLLQKAYEENQRSGKLNEQLKKEEEEILDFLKKDWLHQRENLTGEILDLCEKTNEQQKRLEILEKRIQHIEIDYQQILQGLQKRQDIQNLFFNSNQPSAHEWQEHLKKNALQKNEDQQKIFFPKLPFHFWTNSKEEQTTTSLLFWQMVWQLSSQTLSSPSSEDPLHGCPWPVYTALLSTIRQYDENDLIAIPPLQTHRLSHGVGLYRYYNKRNLSLFRLSPEFFKRIGHNETTDAFYSLLLELEEKKELQHLIHPVIRRLLLHFQRRFRETQAWLLGEIEKSCLKKEKKISFYEREPKDASFSLALLDTLSLIENCMQLFPDIAPESLPEIDFFVEKKKGEETNDAWKAPLHHYLGFPFPKNDFLHFPLSEKEASTFWLPIPRATQLRIQLTQTPPHHACLDVPKNRDKLKILAQSYHKAQPAFVHTLPNYRPSREVLDYFLRRYFPIAELKQEQVSVLIRILSPQNSPPAHLAVLPTGFGKSIIYQLYGMLVPRPTLVISPLNSLIRDQVTSLHSLGYHSCVQALNSSISEKEKNFVLENLATMRLIYISPERLLIQSFREKLKQFFSEKKRLGAFIVDEAHCVSEWGHDFRLAYLQIARIHQELRTNTGEALPIVALTATAPRLVREDICAILNIPPEHVEQRASSDRLNFSFSIHPLPYESPQKQQLLGELLCKIIPKSLHTSPEAFWSPSGFPPRYQQAGMIFGLFINGRQSRRYQENIHKIQATAIQELNQLHLPTPTEKATAVHGSTTPEVCSSCGSPLFYKEYGKLNCENCKYISSTDNLKHWPETIRNNQDRYKQDELSLMIATKGFGMGIDKPNVRFVIHHSLSGSISSYYQEAGRAGRDGKHAHVSLIYQEPCTSCRKDLRKNHEPACVRQTGPEKYWKCPYYDYSKNPGLCDYGLQAGMLDSEYGDSDSVLKGMLHAYKQYRNGQTSFYADKPGQPREVVFYRLQQIGVISSYETSYQGSSSGEDDSFQKRCHLHFPPHFDCGQAKKTLHSTFVRFDAHESIAWLEQWNTTDPIDYIQQAGQKLLGELHRILPQRRYEMLYNQLEFAESTQCRRISLRAIFDGRQGLAEEGYRCGFCDRCQPDLVFIQDQANPPSLTFDAQVFGDEMIRLLEEEDLLSLSNEEHIRNVMRFELTSSIRLRAQHLLELDSTNLAAYYVAGRLGKETDGQQENARNLLQRGMNEAIRQERSIEEVGFFARALSEDEAQWGLFVSEEGPWSSSERLPELAEWFTKQFGKEDPRVQRLRFLCGVRFANDQFPNPEALEHINARLTKLMKRST